MKSFLEYLTESKKVYAFKIKVAGDLDSNFDKKLKDCLTKFSIAKVGAGKRTPIQEVPLDFPDNKNSSVTIYEVETDYPVTAHQLQHEIADICDVDAKNIRVRSNNEPSEHYQAQMTNKSETQESLLLSDLEQGDNQELVGQKHLLSFIKELEKTKHDLAEVEGINDQLLAKTSPTGKSEAMPEGSAISPIGSKISKGK